jgi:hypothetical protein
VTSIRKDISSLWEEVGIDTDEQKSHEFSTYFDSIEELQDSTVEVHEAYFTALKGRVEELRPILVKISRRETIVLERVELENLMLNPERLSARGQNAREDRKREEAMGMRVRGLEKVTKELLVQIQGWEEERGPFMFAGERYSERVASQEENYAEMKENIRNARKKKDGKGTDTARLPIPPKRTVPSQALKTTKVLPPPAVVVEVDENRDDTVRNRSMGSIETDFTSVTILK